MSAMSQWDDSTTRQWLARLGVGQYGAMFTEHNIRGDVLAMLDHEYLMEVGVKSIGHRVRILKAIGSNWQEMDPKEVLQRLALAEAQLQKITEKVDKMRTDLMPVFRLVKENEPLPSLQKNSSSTSIATAGGTTPAAAGSTGLSQIAGPALATAADLTSVSQPNLVTLQRAHSVSVASPGQTQARRYSTIPTSQTVKSPGQLPPQVPPSYGRSASIPGDDRRLSRKPGGFNLITEELTHRGPNSKVSMSTAYEPYKIFRVKMDDPCHKVLPAIMRHYQIAGEPHEYRLVVQYGDDERAVLDHEKPLLLYKELQVAGMRPTFMMRQVASGASQGPSVSSQAPGGIL